jgi:large subunit ribosomal protein L16
MLAPNRVKHRKVSRGRMKGTAFSGHEVNFGDFGIIALAPTWITSRQIEATRVALTRKVRKEGRVWIRVFPDKPFTSKPAETRQGKGKGSPEGWVAVVKPGRVLFEIGGGATEETAKEAFRLASHKLPIPTRMVKRGEVL